MKLKNKFLILTIVCCTVLCQPATVFAQRFVVDLDNPDFVPYPMAVPDVVTTQGEEKQVGLGAKISDVLRSDLEISGIFSVIPRVAYLAPKNEPWTNPSFPDWVKVGASGLIRGAYSLAENDKITVTFRLYDVVMQRELFVKHYDGVVEDHRVLAHKFADDLYHFFTGKHSIFFTKIAFVAKSNNGNKSIYVCDFDGANTKVVVANGKLNLMPSWSRDGEELFFTSYLKDNPDLYRFNLKKQHLSLIAAHKGLNMGANMSPDGKKIAFTLSKDGNTEIYVMNADGSGLTRLTNYWGEDVSPRWSPDSKQLVFVSSRSGNPQLYIMNVDGSGVRRLTFQGNYNTEPDWSPIPGGPIVFSARDERNMFDIFSVDPATGVITRLTQDEGHNNEAPSFAPDGRHIVFTSNRGGNGRKLYIMNLDGTGQRLINSKAGNIDTPAWSPLLMP